MKNTNDQNFVVGLFIIVFFIAGFLWVTQPEPTPEEIMAEAALVEAQAKAEATRIAAEEQARANAEAERQRIREEEHQRRMEEEAMKTPEQKAIEAQNQEMSVGEGVVGAVGIGAAAYIFGKMLDSI